MKYLKLSLLSVGVLFLTMCKKEDPQLGEPATEADAMFTFEASTSSNNVLEFEASNKEIQAVWDLGNGQKGSGPEITGIYPNAGTYEVKLTVFGSGGSASTTQEIIIDQTDPTLLDSPIYDVLTGGDSGPGFKTWVMDSTIAGHFGVGPDPISSSGYTPEWYSAGPLDKTSVGMYDDKYTFYLENFRFDMEVEGDVYVHNGLAGDFPGSYENLNDYTAPYTDQIEESWFITEGAIDTTLTLSGETFMGMWTGFREYKIVSYSDTSLFLACKHFDGGLTWYHRFIPEGFVSSGGGSNTFELPFDFESFEPDFETFGNSTVTFIDNPDPSGINSSARVLETIHGNETWAGFSVDLTEPLDFSVNNSIGLKVWAPATGDFRFKIENSSNPNEFVEVDATVASTNGWIEISADFNAAGAAPGIYDRLVLFPGWNVANAGTFYIDDVMQF